MTIMDSNTAVKITSGGEDYPSLAAHSLPPIFQSDPVIRYMLCSLSPSSRNAYLQPYFSTLMKAAAMNSAEFQEADGWDCIAVWMPPGKRIDGLGTVLRAGFLGCLIKLGVGGCKRMLLDYQSQSDACKKRGLPREFQGRYWYLFFIGTVAEARGRGLASKIIRKQQVVARREGLGMWLEATTAGSREVYRKCGFGVVGQFVLGKGTHAASGDMEEGGPGVVVWAMFWRPESVKE